MTQNSRNLATDIRGGGSLTIDAVNGIVDIVESLHQTIASPSTSNGTADQQRTGGITGMVYRNIRAVTGLVGVGIDAPLNLLGPMLAEKESSPGREAALAALNGFAGDYLVARDNPLAIPMQFRRHGRPLNDQALAEAVQSCASQSQGAASRLVIMVHGAFRNDLRWNRNGHDHGAALARDLGIEPLYLHYNSGLHISENGRKFADLLETTLDQAPQPLELIIIAYSMGGLVARSACHYGKLSGHSWLMSLQKLVFLGTPHHGAPLEKGGHWLNLILEANAYSAPFSRLGKMRSSGITDLRYGYVLDDDWLERDRFEYEGDRRIPVPLPEGVQSYAIAATRSSESNKPCDDLIGDGLVPVSSALGRHKKAELNLSFPESRQWLGHSMNHVDLLNHPQVYKTIKKWLKN